MHDFRKVLHQQAVLKLLNRLPHKSILLSNITYWLGGKKPIIREQDEMWRVQGRNNWRGRGAELPPSSFGQIRKPYSNRVVDYALHHTNVWVKKTETNCSSDILLRFVSFFLTQTLVVEYGYLVILHVPMINQITVVTLQPLQLAQGTLPTAEILSGKNVRAWVSMVLYLKK